MSHVLCWLRHLNPGALYLNNKVNDKGSFGSAAQSGGQVQSPSVSLPCHSSCVELYFRLGMSWSQDGSCITPTTKRYFFSSHSTNTCTAFATSTLLVALPQSVSQEFQILWFFSPKLPCKWILQSEQHFIELSI